MIQNKDVLKVVMEWAKEKNLKPTMKDGIVSAGNEHGMVRVWLSDKMPEGWLVDGAGEHGSLMCDAVIDLLSEDNKDSSQTETTTPKTNDATPKTNASIPEKHTTTPKPTNKTNTPDKKTTPRVPATTNKKTPSTTTTRPRQNVPSSAADQLQDIQDKSARVYKAKSGKEAPTAALAMRAFNEAGGCFEELVHEHTESYVRVTYRGTLDGRTIDATQSVLKWEYLGVKAWQLVNNRIDKHPTILLGVDTDTGLPRINPDVMVEVRITVDKSSVYKQRPAMSWFWAELLQEWSVAVRILQTQVKSIIARQLLNRESTPYEWREGREIAHENEEMEMVQNKRK